MIREIVEKKLDDLDNLMSENSESKVRKLMSENKLKKSVKLAKTLNMSDDEIKEIEGKL